MEGGDSGLGAMLDARIREGGFALALSGGGHRATLATLGAVMAIVDRGLGSKLIQVASVSGGSITNAFVAQRVRLEELGPAGLDDVARELASKVIYKGVLTKAWIVAMFVVPIILGIVVGVTADAAVRALVGSHTWISAIAGGGVTVATLLARGHVVEWLLDRRYFRLVGVPGGRGRRRSPLSSLSGRRIDHVFCMTDLALGLPVYASSQHGGFIWRRLLPGRAPRGAASFQTFGASRLSIAAVVRASAAFPGIAPRRMSVPPDPLIGHKIKAPHVAFLADGGLWNNLGTQVLREDRFLGTYGAWEDGVLRPYGAAPAMPLLCFNGSAPLRPTRPWMFSVPGIALLKSLRQVTEILNANTVLPRVDAMRNAFESRVRWEGVPPTMILPILPSTCDRPLT